jgi:hypothetical protein
MFEQAFKNIDDGLWKEAGCTTELDYTEQTSWLLFLKYLDNLEQERATCQMALGVIPAPQILSSRLTRRKVAPPLMPAAAIHSSTRQARHPDASLGLGLCQEPCEAMIESDSFGPQLWRL